MRHDCGHVALCRYTMTHEYEYDFVGKKKAVFQEVPERYTLQSFTTVVSSFLRLQDNLYSKAFRRHIMIVTSPVVRHRETKVNAEKSIFCLKLPSGTSFVFRDSPHWA